MPDVLRRCAVVSREDGQAGENVTPRTAARRGVPLDRQEDAPQSPPGMAAGWSHSTDPARPSHQQAQHPQGHGICRHGGRAEEDSHVSRIPQAACDTDETGPALTEAVFPTSPSPGWPAGFADHQGPAPDPPGPRGPGGHDHPPSHTPSPDQHRRVAISIIQQPHRHVGSGPVMGQDHAAFPRRAGSFTWTPGPSPWPCPASWSGAARPRRRCSGRRSGSTGSMSRWARPSS